MRIMFLRKPDHALTTFSFKLRKKYGLRGYNVINAPVGVDPVKSPTLFFGLYRKNDFDVLMYHQGLAVVLWAGTDALRQLTNPERVKLLDKPNIKHIAQSDFIEEDLKKAGLKYKRINITANRDVGNPKPLGDSVYFYNGVIPDLDLYNYKLYKEVEKELPHINFISVSPGTYPSEELIVIYEKCFINLRLTTHDGLSNTVVETGLMGRRSVCNNTFPGSYRWENKQDIINAILTEHENIGKTNIKLVEEIENYLNIGDDWLNSDYWL